VSGDFVTTANLAVVVSPVPTSGALVKISGFAGAKGSMPEGAYSSRRLAPRPMPPRLLRRRAFSTSTKAV
jgi:hypothetical protein